MRAIIEVADVLDANWPQVEQSASINKWQLRTLGAVKRCRTAALGSHKTAVSVVTTYVSVTIAAVTATAQNARGQKKKSG